MASHRRRRAGTSASDDAKVGKAAALAAETMQVSTTSVERAARLKKDDPTAFEKVKRGEVKHIPTQRTIFGEEPAPAQVAKPKPETMTCPMCNGSGRILRTDLVKRVSHGPHPELKARPKRPRRV